MWGNPGYSCGCNNDGFGGSWVWIIIIIVFFILFWNNGWGNNNGCNNNCNCNNCNR